MTDEFDVVVIGSGPGGYVCAIRCAQLGLKTACIEKHKRLGGTCLNVGCIPSKTLLHASELYAGAHHLDDFGISVGKPSYDFGKMMERKEQVIGGFAGGIQGLFRKNKVESIQGTAKVTGPGTIDVDGKTIKAKNIVLANGSKPIELPFLPCDEERIVTSTGALSLKEVPQRIILVGAGVIGLELGSVYRRLGAEVTVVEFLDQICPSLDVAMAKELHQVLLKEGMTFHLSSKVVSGERKGDEVHLEVETPEGKQRFVADVALIAIGRKPSSADLPVDKDEKGFVIIDGNFQTSMPGVYAIGDLVEGPMLAHKASEEGVVVAELIAGKQPHINYMAIPNVVYTYPEVAGVGMTEAEAKAAGLTVKTGSFPFKANSRAHCMGETRGLVKVIGDGKTDRMLGMHIIGPHAGEMIQAGVVALEKRCTIREVGAMSHAHPTLAEAIKEACLALHGEQIHI